MTPRKVNRLRLFLKDRNKKNYFKIIKEVIVLFFLKKEVPKYYFKHLYKKKVKDYRFFIGTKEADRIHHSKKLHKFEHTSIIANKLSFATYFESLNLPTPKCWSYNFGKCFFYDNKLIEVHSHEAFIRFFERVFSNSKKDELFIKPISLSGGQGCLKLGVSDLPLLREREDVYNELIAGGFVHVDYIEQHEKIRKIHGQCVNTLRLLTLINDRFEVEMIPGYMRFGLGTSVVDNTSSGGFYVAINKNGALDEIGWQTMDYGGAQVRVHPDTNYKFGGVQIPFYSEASDLVKKAAKCIPDRLIGWDIAISNQGPVIVEANEYPDLHMMDIVTGGLLKHESFKKLVAAI